MTSRERPFPLHFCALHHSQELLPPLLSSTSSRSYFQPPVAYYRNVVLARNCLYLSTLTSAVSQLWLVMQSSYNIPCTVWFQIDWDHPHKKSMKKSNPKLSQVVAATADRAVNKRKTTVSQGWVDTFGKVSSFLKALLFIQASKWGNIWHMPTLTCYLPKTWLSDFMWAPASGLNTLGWIPWIIIIICWKFRKS